MKVGDRVLKEKVLNVQEALGTVKSIRNGYTVVVWDEVNGEWHYTEAQAKSLELVNE
jgi:hypothetical protein